MTISNDGLLSDEDQSEFERLARHALNSERERDYFYVYDDGSVDMKIRIDDPDKLHAFATVLNEIATTIKQRRHENGRSYVLKVDDETYGVVFRGVACSPVFNSHGAASVYLDMIARGRRRPEFAK